MNKAIEQLRDAIRNHALVALALAFASGWIISAVVK